MTPPEEGEHFRVTLRCPQNVYSLDFVLSNVPEGEGTYDNHGGRDYHLPVQGVVRVG